MFSISHVMLLARLFYRLIAFDNRHIEPLEDDAGTYLHYGAIRVNGLPNYIRVRNLRFPFNDETTNLNVTVTFEDLDTGESTLFNGSSIAFINYFACNDTGEPRLPDRLYRVIVFALDRNGASTSFKTPKITVLQTSTELSRDVTSIGCATRERLRFQYVERPPNIRIWVDFTYQSVSLWIKMVRVGCDEYVEVEEARDLLISSKQKMVNMCLITVQSYELDIVEQGLSYVGFRLVQNEINWDQCRNATMNLGNILKTKGKYLINNYLHLVGIGKRGYPVYCECKNLRNSFLNTSTFT